MIRKLPEQLSGNEALAQWQHKMHEFANELQCVVLKTELAKLKSCGNHPDELSELVHTLNRSACKAAEMLEDLRSHARALGLD